MADYSHATFNESVRLFDTKAIIYFDPLDPTEFTKNDALIDFAIMEELWDDAKSVFGQVSVNTLDLTLDNGDYALQPTNSSSEFYGMIQKGVKIELYGKIINLADTLPWLPLGTFYVTDWQAPAGSAVAHVYASDKMQSVFDSNKSSIQVVVDNSYATFLTYYFTQLGHSATVDSSLTEILPYGWSDATSPEDLSLHVQAALASCYCDREDNILINALVATRSLEATLTDADQIIAIKTQQSLQQAYSGAKITYYVPVKTPDTKVLDAQKVSVSVGDNSLDTFEFAKGPVYALEHVACQAEAATAYVKSLSYTPWETNLIVNSSSATDINILAYGTIIDFTSAVISDDTDNVLSYENKFIQDALYAETFKSVFTAYAESLSPFIEVDIIGDLLLTLGMKVRVLSNYYSMDYTGVIVRIKTDYDGGLRQTLTLIDSSIFELTP